MKGNNMKLWTKIVSIVLVAGGILLLLYPLFTNVYSRVFQWKTLQSIQDSPIQTSSIKTSSEEKNNSLFAEAEPSTGPMSTQSEATPVIPKEFGEAVLEIPTLQLTVVVLKGTSQDVLAKAPGWYEESALPGQGNTAIAGHLNIYGSWFKNIDKLKPGERITLKHAGQAYLYEVERVYPVKSTDWSIVKPYGYNALTLSTCISGDRSRRLIVRARQVSVNPPTEF